MTAGDRKMGSRTLADGNDLGVWSIGHHADAFPVSIDRRRREVISMRDKRLRHFRVVSRD